MYEAGVEKVAKELQFYPLPLSLALARCQHRKPPHTRNTCLPPNFLCCESRLAVGDRTDELLPGHLCCLLYGHIQIFTRTRTCIHTYMHKCMHTYIHTCEYLYQYAYEYIFI